MEELATSLLEGKYKFQTFFEQVSTLLEKNDSAYISRIEYKATFEFLAKLDQFTTQVEHHYFTPTDLRIRLYVIPSWFIAERYTGYQRLPVLKRFLSIAKDIEENIKFYYQYEITAAERAEIRKAVNGMFNTTNLRELYKDFYQWLEKPELLKAASRSAFEYADVFPFIYLKMKLEGYKPDSKVKHLLVDEMQDYTPVQYAVLSKLFPAKKTILGDANQSLNPYSSSSAELIQKVFPGSDRVTLRRSYRSTYQISTFAQQIQPNEELIAMERHGEVPTVVCLQNEEEEIAEIKKRINEFRSSDYQSFGIICKTTAQAGRLEAVLKEQGLPVYLLNAESVSFVNGIVITTAHMAKGLEFDVVMVPFATSKNYNTTIDKGMLYIACTRAMHLLHISYARQITKFIGHFVAVTNDISASVKLIEL